MHASPDYSTTALQLDSLDPVFIQETVARIVQSRRFVSSPILSHLIEYLARETMEGRGDRIKQFTIATDVLGRREDFQPEADPIVRVTVARLRKTLEAYYATEGINDLIRFTIPTGSYRLVLQAFKTTASYSDQTGARLSTRLSPARLQLIMTGFIMLLVVLNFIGIRLLISQQGVSTLKVDLRQHKVAVSKLHIQHGPGDL